MVTMENKMSFVFLLSLKEIAMRRVAINAWNQPDVLVSIANFCKVSPGCCNYSENWRETVENKVIDDLSKLVIPVSLSKELLLVVTPIGVQIPKWKVFHDSYLEMPYSEMVFSSVPPNEDLEDLTHLFVGLEAPVLEKLRWTAAGMIDYRQTAEELIRCEMVDAEKRYRLACLYCLEDCIPRLWEELPEGVKRKYYNGENISHIQHSFLPYCWPHIIKGEQSKLECLIKKINGDQRSFNQIAFSNSIANGNKFATEFFYQKLSNEERSFSSVTTDALLFLGFRVHKRDLVKFPPEHSGNVLFYLLSKMDHEERMEVIQSFPNVVLNIFMEWPWQDIFLKIADLIWGLFSTEMYEILLMLISRFFRFSDYSHPKFFQKCFTCSPIDFRKNFVDYECRYGDFFPRFFDIQDSETIKVVFRNIDAADRVRLVSSAHILKLFRNCILEKRLHLVEVCLREARLSKEDKDRVKEAFMEFLTRPDGGQMEKSKPALMSFIKTLNEIAEISKRKRRLEDETRNKAKKSCSDELERESCQ